MRRLFSLLIVLVAVWLGVASAGPVDAASCPALHTYNYDAHHGHAATRSATFERGPPSFCHTDTTSGAVAPSSHGTLARSHGPTPGSTTTYTTPAGLARIARDTGTTQARVSGDAAPISSLTRAGVAAETGSAATKELTTYYPPNRGFLGNSVKKTLEPGTRIDRYGREGGSFVSPEGTPLEMRALPPGSGSRAYNVYEVLHPFEVDSGTVAPWFGQLGLGTQYEVPGSIADLLEQGLIKGVN